MAKLHMYERFILCSSCFSCRNMYRRSRFHVNVYACVYWVSSQSNMDWIVFIYGHVRGIQTTNPTFLQACTFFLNVLPIFWWCTFFYFKIHSLCNPLQTRGRARVTERGAGKSQFIWDKWTREMRKQKYGENDGLTFCAIGIIILLLYFVLTNFWYNGYA